MRKIFEWLQAMLTAAALAEEGEVEAARRIVAEAEGDEVRGRRKVEPIRRPRPPRALAKGSGA